ncbi:MAG TPA: zinc-ribbon domain-containing protein [Longimicrobiales bacterium]|nr:zinc-ribbon domain-containing protein [Longimicrobiales bacterium]
MNIRCPHCQTLFRVDPARVPPRGIRARCARCGGTFQIAGTSPPDATAGAAATEPGASRSGEPHGPYGGEPAPQAGRPASPGATGGPASQAGSAALAGQPSNPAQSAPDARQGGESGARTPGAPVNAGAGAPAQPASGSQRPVFGSRDPNARAQRIARALVSDIVAYHPDRRDQAIEAGTLRSEFRDEIMKSWDEYVAQVGQETAKSTPFFRQALNDILARGQAVF